uniref:Uncharacterized protein n=1 Tax=Rhizophora mucronata TaxID=61149 RepID=A0A2P2JKR0_RHIMU
MKVSQCIFCVSYIPEIIGSIFQFLTLMNYLFLLNPLFIYGSQQIILENLVFPFLLCICISDFHLAFNSSSAWNVL